MLYRPHVAQVEAPAKVQETTSRKTTNLHFAGSVEVKCQVTPATQAQLEQFGVLELRLPHLLMAKIDDAENLPLGARVTVNGRVFTIVTPVQRWDALPGVNSCGVMLQESVATVASGLVPTLDLESSAVPG